VTSWRNGKSMEARKMRLIDADALLEEMNHGKENLSEAGICKR
jgi:hypothetical protein